MKRITIGRGNDCDIVIPDETDDVSRHHFVLSFNFFGKMTASDISSNGTFINNNRILKGASVPVTPKDNIRLGNKWQFDWSLVNDPYKTMRRIIIILLCVILLGGIGGGVWYFINENSSDKENTTIIPKADDSQDDSEWNSDSTKKVAPTVVSISTQKALKQKPNRKKKKAKSVNNIKKRSISKEDIVKTKESKEEKDMPLVIN